VRSLFAKIFISTLVIYPISRGLGFLTLHMLNVPGPILPPQPAVLAQLLPAEAQAALTRMEHGGNTALAAFLDEQQRAMSMRLSFQAVAADACPRVTPTETERRRRITVPITATDGATYCLTAQPDRFDRRFLMITLGLVSMELACCVAVSYLLARYLVGPLQHLHAAAIAFAGGDLSARGRDVTTGRRDEVAELVRAFNRMADRVSALIQAQRRFIVDVSHEIKSPLARLSLAAALARRSAGANADAQFDRLEREIETASSLVRELQVLSSLETAASLERRAPVNLAEMLAAAIDNVAFEWKGHAHGIRLAAPAEPVVTLGDPGMLQRAVENVLRNALFYTPEGTEVDIAVSREADAAHIEVRDYGPGVSEASLYQLFNPFFRVDESRTRNTGGVGIGLAIFERTIALHGGKATARNATPCGLRISIELPLAPAMTEPDDPTRQCVGR
jgi:two-component system sensor histidine kinase CpxA